MEASQTKLNKSLHLLWNAPVNLLFFFPPTYEMSMFPKTFWQLPGVQKDFGRTCVQQFKGWWFSKADGANRLLPSGAEAIQTADQHANMLVKLRRFHFLNVMTRFSPSLVLAENRIPSWEWDQLCEGLPRVGSVIVDVRDSKRSLGTGSAAGWCTVWGLQVRLNQTLQFDWCLAASEVFHLLLCEEESSSAGTGHWAFREEWRDRGL